MMLSVLRKILVDISTGIDGKTFCYARIWGHIGGISYLGLAIYNAVTTHEFNQVAFGTGFAAIIGSVGGAIWAKKDTEPGISQ